MLVQSKINNIKSTTAQEIIRNKPKILESSFTCEIGISGKIGALYVTLSEKFVLFIK